MDNFKKFLENYKLALTVIGLTVVMTIGTITKFVTADEFRQYKNEQQYKDDVRERRSLRQEVSEFKEDIKQFGPLPPAALKAFEEAKEELEDIRESIKAYREAKKEKLS